MALIPYVIEQNQRGERVFDIYSRKNLSFESSDLPGGASVSARLPKARNVGNTRLERRDRFFSDAQDAIRTQVFPRVAKAH